jgi:hypothetical protein
MRLGVVAGGALVGGLALSVVSGGGSQGSSGDEGDPILLLGAAVGATAGALCASMVDAFVYSYEDIPPRAHASVPPLSSVTLTPRVSVTRERTTFGLSGAF